MSVFRQLMMKEKYKLMPLTVVGSPTIQDGVVSGFSSGNYIKLNNVDSFDNQQNLEFKLKINTSDLSATQDLICCSSFGLLIRLLTTGKLTLYLSSDGTSWNVANNLQSSNILSINTTYFMKFSFDGSVYKLQISTDDVNYTDYITLSSTSIIKFKSGSYFGFGSFYNGNTNFFSGSIDFNNSYVISAGTKYKFTIGA